MSMFQGGSEISMDAKGRIAIPTKIRDLLLPVCKGEIVVTASVDSPCLSLYPITVWQDTVVPQVERLPSVEKAAIRAKRLVFGYAETFQLDANGRVQLTPLQRAYGRFEKKLTMVGMINKYEIWDAEAWASTTAELDDGEIPESMKSLNI